MPNKIKQNKKQKRQISNIADLINQLCNSSFSKNEQLNISTWMNLKSIIVSQKKQVTEKYMQFDFTDVNLKTCNMKQHVV